MKKLICAVLAACTLLSLPGAAMAQDALKNTDPEKYLLYLNIPNQVVTVFEKDDAGEYTRIVRRMLCTSGAQLTPTPTGTYKIGARERFGKFANFNNEYARYWTQVVRGIYLHSIMFTRRDAANLQRGAYGALGGRASHGCIRLYVEDAKWLYYHACPGTTITIGNEHGITREEKKGLRSTMDYAEYKAFQQNIFDIPEPPAEYAWITSDGATLRTGNGSNDKYIRRLAPGTAVQVLQEGDPWVKVDVDGKEGYVKRIYVTYTEGGRDTYENGRATKTTTNIYPEPNIKAEVLCRMPRDTSLNVLQADEAHGWYKVRYWDVEGYIRIRNTREDLSLYPFDPEPADFFPPVVVPEDSSGNMAAEKPAEKEPAEKKRSEKKPAEKEPAPVDSSGDVEDVPDEALLDG